MENSNGKPEARESWRSAIIWSVALAAFSLGAAWTIANWEVLHLVWCRHLLSSKDEMRQIDGIQKVALTHLRAGLTKDEVVKLFWPVRMDGPMEGSSADYHLSKTETGFYVVHPLADGDGCALVFDERDKLVKWWIVP